MQYLLLIIDFSLSISAVATSLCTPVPLLYIVEPVRIVKASTAENEVKPVAKTSPSPSPPRGGAGGGHERSRSNTRSVTERTQSEGKKPSCNFSNNNNVHSTAVTRGRKDQKCKLNNTQSLFPYGWCNSFVSFLILLQFLHEQQQFPAHLFHLLEDWQQGDLRPQFHLNLLPLLWGLPPLLLRRIKLM